MFQNPELKINKEFEDLLHTDTDCTPLFMPFFYKKIVRDSNGNKIPCPACNAKVSGLTEGSIDCAYCQTVGYKWTEGIYKGWFYKQSFMTDRSIATAVPTKMALANFNKQFLVFDKHLELNQDDIILRPKVDDKGLIKIPVEKKDMYKISESETNSGNQTFSEFNTVTLVSTFGDYFRRLLKNNE